MKVKNDYKRKEKGLGSYRERERSRVMGNRRVFEARKSPESWVLALQVNFDRHPFTLFKVAFDYFS